MASHKATSTSEGSIFQNWQCAELDHYPLPFEPAVCDDEDAAAAAADVSSSGSGIRRFS